MSAATEATGALRTFVEGLRALSCASGVGLPAREARRNRRTDWREAVPCLDALSQLTDGSVKP